MSDPEGRNWHHAEVRCLSGFRADERPITLKWGDREMKIRRIRTSWREPNHLYFVVETDDGGVYSLRHHEYEDSWQVRPTGRYGIGGE